MANAGELRCHGEEEEMVWCGQSEPAAHTSAPTWMDGWCSDRILFSIHVPSQIDIFFFALSQPWSALISIFFWQLYFLPAHPPTHPTIDLPTNTLK
jgi:hypothetical protein